ncbi:MAG TPA: hypothetical protein VHO24_06245 [Opitutaceae bacterium]|nr:hypothetical protein [Opitutaceae bacterium]
MKTKLLALAAFFTGVIAADAAPLAATTAVHSKPDEKSPTLTVLKAGTEPVTPSGISYAAPSGWMAVELSGPHTGYVQNKDLTKSLDVAAGAPIYLTPKADTNVLTIAEKDDRSVIDGVLGKWSRISLERKLVGYIKVPGAPVIYPSSATSPAPMIQAAPEPTPSPVVTPAPVISSAPVITAPVRSAPVVTSTPAPTPSPKPAPAPVADELPAIATAPAVAASATSADTRTPVAPGRAAPMASDGSSATLPRSFQGKFVSTRRPLAPRHPYDWALNDEGGKRYALLDVSKLLQTEQIEKYTDRMVVVYGTAKPSPNGRDILIQVESLQLK